MGGHEWQVGDSFEVWWQETATFVRAEILVILRPRVCLCLHLDRTHRRVQWFDIEKVKQIVRPS